PIFAFSAFSAFSVFPSAPHAPRCTTSPAPTCQSLPSTLSRASQCRDGWSCTAKGAIRLGDKYHPEKHLTDQHLRLLRSFWRRPQQMTAKPATTKAAHVAMADSRSLASGAEYRRD